MYTYAWYHWLTFFYIYCFFGWIFESTYVSLKQHHFVNRGFLRGPMLPIYGFGAVILLHVSLPLYDKPVALFLASMVAATVFEYIVGVIMEKGAHLPAILALLGLSRADSRALHSPAGRVGDRLPAVLGACRGGHHLVGRVPLGRCCIRPCGSRPCQTA